MASPKTTASSPTAKAGSCSRSDRLTASEMEWLANDHKITGAEALRLWKERDARIWRRRAGK